MKKAGKKLCHSNDHTGISKNQELIMELMLSTKPLVCYTAIRQNYIPLSSITIIYAHI